MMAGDRHIEKTLGKYLPFGGSAIQTVFALLSHLRMVELNVNLRCTESRKFIHHLHDNAMTDVHGYDILVVSFTIVFHYSVGFDIAYPQVVGMREPRYTG